MPCGHSKHMLLSSICCLAMRHALLCAQHGYRASGMRKVNLFMNSLAGFHAQDNNAERAGTARICG